MVRRLAALLAILSLPAAATGQEATMALDLHDAVALARRQSPAVVIARAQVEQAEAQRSSTRTSFFPVVSSLLRYGVYSNRQAIVIPEGRFGTLPDGTPIPTMNDTIDQGGRNRFAVGATIAQPITQLFKVAEGTAAATAAVDAADAGLRSTQASMTVAVIQAYAALVVARQEFLSKEVSLRAANARLSQAEDAVVTGEVLEVVAVEARAAALNAQQDVLIAENEIDAASIDLALLLGLPTDTEFELADPPPAEPETESLEQLLAQAFVTSPDLEQAQALLSEADHSVSLARADYIPNVTLTGSYIRQDEVAFFRKNIFNLGITVEWNVFQFGKRRYDVAQQVAVRDQAQENLDLVQGQVRGNVEKAYRKVNRSLLTIQVAREALEARRMAAAIRADEAEVGSVLPDVAEDALAMALEAEAELLAAEFGYQVARAELAEAVGVPVFQ